MDKSPIEVEMLKMIDPGCYLVKEKGITRNSREFDELCIKMDAYFNSDAFVTQMTTPVLGENYIGKERDKWYRIRVDMIVQRTAGPHASCYLLDYGKDGVMIPLRWIRRAKEEFFRVPIQVKRSVLHNLQPITLVMDPDLNNSWGPASKWDESSASYMRDLFKMTKSWKAIFVSEKDGSYEIELYATSNMGTVHINDILVQKKFAVFKDCDLPKAASVSPGSPSEDRAAYRAAKSIGTNYDQCRISSASPSPNSSLRPMSRGALLKSLIANACEPQVGRRSTEPGSSASDSDNMLPQRAGQLRSTGLTKTSPASSRGSQFSNSDQDIERDSGRDRRVAGQSSPGSTVLSQSGVESCQKKSAAAFAAKSSMESGRLSSGAPVQSRLPRHLRMGASDSSGAANRSDFVTPNTNLLPLPASARKDSSPVHSNIGVVSFRTDSPEVKDSCPNSSFKPSSVPGLSSVSAAPNADGKKADPKSRAEKIESSRLTIPVVSTQPTADDLEILLDGNKFIKCVTDLNEQPFIDLIRKTPGLMEMDRPTSLQSFVWPAVMRGFDVVGIAASKYRDGSPGGKSLSYLLPLFSLLNFRSTYKDLPKYSISPYVLILCPTWNQALKIYDQCQHILKHQHELRLHQIKIRVNLLFGGGGDENQEVNMINGCEILVSTPHSYLRMMDRKLTNLSRVCHLVLEEANVLVDQFKPEVDRVMDQYKLELKERQGGSVPQQVLIFSQRWSSALKKFSLESQVSPVVVVASKMEASYYGGVRHQPLMCMDQQRFTKVLSLLELRKKKVLVFTSRCEEAKILQEAIRSASIYALLATDEMDSSDLELVKREWFLPHRADSQPVLVVTDRILSILNISDAGWIIHFDVPSQLEVFADRLWCLRKSFESYEEETLIKADERVSVILVTELCVDMSSRLIQVLQRCGNVVPPSLLAMSEKHTEKKERGKQSQLCHSLRSFGFCRNKTICPYRHKIYSCLDQPGVSSRYIALPTEGTIRVWIKSVVDASCFYVNLVEHKDPDGNSTSLRKDSSELSVEMTRHFSRPSSKHPIAKAFEGKLYAMEDLQHIFHRVEVIRVFASESADIPDEVEVFQVDIGETFTVKISEMYELPPNLVDVPYQAVEVFICRIKPVDNDFTWTRKAQMHLVEKIQDETLDGNIVLSLGNALWLDPLQKRTWVPEFNFWQHAFTVRSLLLEAKFAEENPKHLEMLYEACDGIVELPSGLSTALSTTHAFTIDGCLVRTKTEEFAENNDRYQDVYVTAVKSPDLLYVQLASNENLLNQLNEEIKHYMILADVNVNFEPKKGLLVLAKDSDCGWCRGRIEEMPEGQPIEVFFVDTGITDDFLLKDIIPMPVRFKQVPFQAMECSLIGLEPVQGAYLDKCADCILSLTADQQENPIKLQALVVRKTEARYSGRYHYGINLHDFSSACYHVNLASQLVVEKFAKLASDKLMTLYPFAYDDRAADPYKMQFSVLCRDFLRNESKEKVIEMAAELERLTEEVCSRNSSFSGLVTIVGQTLEYSWEPEIAHAVILSLKLLIKYNQDHCAELLNGNIIDVLCHMFIKHKSNGLQEELLLLFSSITACSRCCEMFMKCGGLWYLANDLLNSDVDFIIQAESQLVLTTLKNTRESGLTIGHVKCLEAAVKHLDCSDLFVVRHCLEIIDFLVSCFSKYKDEIRKHHGIKVMCYQLDTWSDKKVLCQALKILAMLTVDNRFNRDEVAQNLPSGLGERFPTDADIQNLFADLMNRIQRSLPSAQFCSAEQIKTSPLKSTASKIGVNPQPINNQPIPKELLTVVSDYRRPNVKWTQSLWDILLTVEVKDAKKLQEVASFATDSITFRAVALATEYSFHFALYELIVPEKCETSINAGCVYVGLKKKSRGIWPRLLRDKLLKCSFLSADFNRFEDVLEGHSDEETEDGDQFNSPLGLVHCSVESMSLPAWHLPSSGDTVSKYKDATPDLATSKNKSSRSDDSSSSLESDEELDSKFDPRYVEDSRLGYHTF